MKEGLEKIIYKIILPKFPWIEDFEVKVYTFRPALGGFKKIAYQNYEVRYFVHPDENGGFTVTDEFAEVEDLTQTLFKMISPEHYQRFVGVVFTVKD